MARISRKKKVVRVIKRKLLKPVLYAIGMSLVIYLAIGNMVLRKRSFDNAPHFIITRISDKYDATEFMHLLLTVQEVNMLPKAHEQLIEFVNRKYDGTCPAYLEKQLNRMNWAPQAFYVRVRKMFALYDIYDRISRFEETIHFLSEEIENNRLPRSLESQVEILEYEKNNILKKDLTPDEYKFIREYSGLVQRLKIIEVKK